MSKTYGSSGELVTVGRFAPSPTGRMHAGNVYTALVAWLIAKSEGGDIVLRIEDLDRERSKPEFVDLLMRDFELLGLTWDKGPYFQSARSEAYRAAADELTERGFVYPCFCSRADLRASSAPHAVADRQLYPGTCRTLTRAQQEKRKRDRNPSLRLIVPDISIEVPDTIQGGFTQNLAKDCGDFVIHRADGIYAYQLAVVLDDADQGISSVVRGYDLLSSTPQQIYLRTLLDLDVPTYSHIPLITDGHHRRLSKRDHDADMDVLMMRFKTPEAVIGHLAGITGIAPSCDPITPHELLEIFSLESLRGKSEIPWY